MIRTFRKKDTTVQAIFCDGSPGNAEEIRDFLPPNTNFTVDDDEASPRILYHLVDNSGKVITVYNTNWLIKDGKHYFIASDNIFKDMYEEVV